MIQKVRAWHKKEKKMYEVASIDFENKEVLFTEMTESGESKKWAHFEDCDIMTSTGLEVKNSKELFGGDIFKYGKTSEGKDILYEVYWSEPIAGFKWRQITPCMIMGMDIKEAIKIGNIHENPELLKGVKA